MSYLEKILLESSKRELFIEEEKKVLNKANDNISWIRDNLIREIKCDIEALFVVFSHSKTSLVIIPINPVFNEFSMALIVDNYPISEIRFTANSELNLEECKQILLEKEELLNDTSRLICNYRSISFEYFDNCINLYNKLRMDFVNNERYKIIFDKNLNMTLKVSPDDKKMKDKAEKLKKMHDYINIEHERLLPKYVEHESSSISYLGHLFYKIRNGIYSDQ